VETDGQTDAIPIALRSHLTRSVNIKVIRNGVAGLDVSLHSFWIRPCIREQCDDRYTGPYIWYNDVGTPLRSYLVRCDCSQPRRIGSFSVKLPRSPCCYRSQRTHQVRWN